MHFCKTYFFTQNAFDKAENMNKQRLSYHFFIALIAALCVIVGCKSKKDLPADEPQQLVQDVTANEDSVEEDSTNAQEIVPIPPKKADELFDDFAFTFMKNKKFQKMRIKFPLPYSVDGEKQQITEKQWQYDSMYSSYEMYTLIFDSTKGEKAAKDTTLHRVVVEELNLDSQRAKSYDFRRENGEWRLTSLAEGDMEHSENSDFYSFYHKFATDEDFQLEHIASPLVYSTFDDDEFKMVERKIDPEEFVEHSPELPKSQITNILYGQSFKNSKMRILSLRAPASGMECQMVFKKIGKEWKLTRLDN